jgi:hypothetical protein
VLSLTTPAPTHPPPSRAQAAVGRSAALAAPAEPAAPTLAELGITDIDLADSNDPHNVTEYVAEIYKHYRTTEVRAQPWRSGRGRWSVGAQCLPSWRLRGADRAT